MPGTWRFFSCGLRQIQIIHLTLAVPLLAQIPRGFPYFSITYMSACGPVWLRLPVHLPSVVLLCYWVASVFVVAAVRDMARCVQDYGLPAPSTSVTSRHCTSCTPILSTRTFAWLVTSCRYQHRAHHNHNPTTSFCNRGHRHLSHHLLDLRPPHRKTFIYPPSQSGPTAHWGRGGRSLTLVYLYRCFCT